MKDKSPKNSYLTPYHVQRNKEAIEGVKEMQKIPVTKEQFIAQCKQLREEAKNYHKR